MVRTDEVLCATQFATRNGPLVAAISENGIPCKTSQPVARLFKRSNRQGASGTSGVLVYRYFRKSGRRPVVSSRISSQFSRWRDHALHLQTQGPFVATAEILQGTEPRRPLAGSLGCWIVQFESSSPAWALLSDACRTTCGSHAAAWKALDSPVAKSAHRSRFGDIYEPRQTLSPQPWRDSSYESHLRDHVHDAKGRAYDIERTFHGRHPRLLIGDSRHSYLWSRSLITLHESADADWASAHHRFYPRMADFLTLCE
jgi:hypothetical protein